MSQTDIAKRLRASVAIDAINGGAWERAVCARQMIEAANAIDALRRAARLIHARHGMVSGSLEMAECDAVCAAAGLEVWKWPPR